MHLVKAELYALISLASARFDDDASTSASAPTRIILTTHTTLRGSTKSCRLCISGPGEGGGGCCTGDSPARYRACSRSAQGT